ncbi:MAG: exosortase/archaeosortase family protein [Phycisphaerae bacterium]|nr:exosortase/archaeosortase family protein [Phycisphaerae bacterium]
MKRQDESAAATISKSKSRIWPAFAVSVSVLAAVVWQYWPTALELVAVWRTNQDYSIGQLVPLAALWLLWHKRTDLRRCAIRPCGWGLALIVLAEAAWCLGLVFDYGSAMRYALVLAICGVVLTLTGPRVFNEVKWILLFLFLMVPLPHYAHDAISNPLQTVATRGAVFFLELGGVMVSREGNVIVLANNVRLGVVEACSGLRMLTAFFVVAAVFVYVCDRRRWQKMILLGSSVLIAVAGNLIRLVVTALLYLHAESKTAEVFFHDFAGWMMMPLALILLAGLRFLLDVFFPEDRPPCRHPVRPANRTGAAAGAAGPESLPNLAATVQHHRK